MRPLEILSLSFLLLTVLFLFFKRERFLFLLFLFFTIIMAIAQYFIEGFRWQLAFYIYLLPAVYLCHRIENEYINFKTKVFFVVWYLLAVIIPYRFPYPKEIILLGQKHFIGLIHQGTNGLQRRTQTT